MRLARLRAFLANPILIGPPECPILKRWAIYGGGSLAAQGVAPLWGDQGRWSLKVHHFLPNADDRDVHDHPWWFVTLVLKGRYDDMRECPACDGEGMLGASIGLGLPAECMTCGGERVTVREHMTPGKLRFRPATHAHRTQVGPDGCWTIVLTGPKVRTWGFWRGGKFWSRRTYERLFGFGMRCD